MESVIKRLLEENLHGATLAGGTSFASLPHLDNSDSDWVSVDSLTLSNQQDLDAKDPRWLELFIEVF